MSSAFSMFCMINDSVHIIRITRAEPKRRAAKSQCIDLVHGIGN